MTTHRHTTHHYWRLTAPTSKLCKDVRCNQWWWDSLPKTNSSSLKIGGWKTIFLLGNPMFRCYIRFREGNPVTSSCTKIIVNHGFATCGLGKDSVILSILWNQNMRVWKHSVLVNLPGVKPCRTIRVQQDFRTCDPFRVASSIHIDITSIFTFLPNFPNEATSYNPNGKKNCAREFPGGSLEWLISAIAGKENENANIAKTLLSIMSSIHTWCVQLFGFKSDASILVSLGSEPFRLWIFRKFHLEMQANQVKSFNLLRGNFSVKKESRSAVGSCDI